MQPRPLVPKRRSTHFTQRLNVYKDPVVAVVVDVNATPMLRVTLRSCLVCEYMTMDVTCAHNTTKLLENTVKWIGVSGRG